MDCSSKEIINFGDARIELIEEYPCNNKMELNRREGEIIRERNCVNQKAAYQSKEERKEYNKEYQKEYQQTPQYKKYKKEHNKEYQNTSEYKEYRKAYDKERRRKKKEAKFISSVDQCTGICLQSEGTSEV